MLKNEIFNRPYVRDITKTCECACSLTCNPDIITNADRIRSMSDEELAILLGDGCPYNMEPGICGGLCANCWLEWLQQPYKEGET